MAFVVHFSPVDGRRVSSPKPPPQKKKKKKERKKKTACCRMVFDYWGFMKIKKLCEYKDDYFLC